jgi:hypothetical protein
MTRRNEIREAEKASCTELVVRRGSEEPVAEEMAWNRDDGMEGDPRFRDGL